MTESEDKKLIEECASVVKRLTADECCEAAMCNEAASVIMDLVTSLSLRNGEVAKLDEELKEADAGLIWFYEHYGYLAMEGDEHIRRIKAAYAAAKSRHPASGDAKE